MGFVLRTFEPVPAAVTTELGAAALVAADRMGQFRRKDLAAVLAAAGLSCTERWLGHLLGGMERDGLVRRVRHSKPTWWAITKKGEEWAGKVWTGPALAAWGYRPRQLSRHRELVNELFAGVAAVLDGAPVLGLWRSHGRAAVGTYEVSYDPDARVDLDGLSVWVEVDRGTVWPSRLQHKLGRLREVLAFRDFGKSRCIRVLWVLESPSPTRFRQLSELFAAWLGEWLCMAPEGMAGERAGAGPALEIWVGPAEACLGRLREEWPFWAGRSGAVPPHRGVAEHVATALRAAGYKAAVTDGPAPAGAWRMSLVTAGAGRPGLVVLDGRHSGALAAWAERAEEWAAVAQGGMRTYACFVLADDRDAELLSGRRVLWTTPARLAADGGLCLAPRRAGAAPTVAPWARIVGPVPPGPERAAGPMARPGSARRQPER